MTPADVEALRRAVESIAHALMPAYMQAQAAINRIMRNAAMSQATAIERQIVSELTRQGADTGTANVAARHAMELYGMQSRMGNASLAQVMKAAGEYAERTQKGFKYRARSR